MVMFAIGSIGEGSTEKEVLVAWVANGPPARVPIELQHTQALLLRNGLIVFSGFYVNGWLQFGIGELWAQTVLGGIMSVNSLRVDGDGLNPASCLPMPKLCVQTVLFCTTPCLG